MTTKYASNSSTAHELNEHVLNILKYRQQAFSANPQAVADDIAHGLAFHRGLGETITPSTAVPIEKYLSADALAEFAQQAFAKPNIALASSGPNSADLSKWVGEFFKDLPSAGSSNQYKLQPNVASKYYGGEQRVSSKAGNAVVIAFPGSSAFGTSGFKPEVSILASLLGGESTIKWTPGFSLLAQATQGFSQLNVSTKNHAYSDAGLFTVSLSGKADQVAAGSKNVVDTLKKVAAGEASGENIKKASAMAKFRALESLQNLDTGVEATGSALVNGRKPYNVSEIAQALDKVTEQQVKDVSIHSSLETNRANSPTGCQVYPHRQGLLRRCWGSIPAPIRRGSGLDCLECIQYTLPSLTWTHPISC